MASRLVSSDQFVRFAFRGRERKRGRGSILIPTHQSPQRKRSSCDGVFNVFAHSVLRRGPQQLLIDSDSGRRTDHKEGRRGELCRIDPRPFFGACRWKTLRQVLRASTAAVSGRMSAPPCGLRGFRRLCRRYGSQASSRVRPLLPASPRCATGCQRKISQTRPVQRQQLRRIR